MKFIKTILLVVLVLLTVLICCKYDTKRKIITDQQKVLIQEYIKDYPDNTQISIAVIKNSKVEFLGYQIIDDSIKKVDNKDSVFEVGSISKVFTSTILSNLILKNKIAVDEPIAKTLPFKLNPLEKNASKITFKNLSNHTSGLPNYPSNLGSVARLHPLNPYVEYDSLLLKEYLIKELRLLSIPNTKIEYSNLGYGLLGYLLELKTGKKYEDLLQNFVFKRYNMPFSTSRRNKIFNYLVKGHDKRGRVVPNWDFNIHDAAGACFSSTYDLSKFVFANFSNDPVLNFQRQRTFSIGNGNVDLAFAWNIFTEKGVSIYFHSGRTGGYKSNITMDLEKKNAVILLVNSVYGQSEKHLLDISWKLLKTI